MVKEQLEVFARIKPTPTHHNNGYAFSHLESHIWLTLKP